MKPFPDAVIIQVTAPGSDAGRAALRAYLDDVASRFYGRPAGADEVDAALREDPSDDLAPPSGGFWGCRDAVASRPRHPPSRLTRPG